MNRESVHNISVRDLDVRKVVFAHAGVCEDGAQHSDAGLKLKDVEIFIIFFNELEENWTF